MAGKLKPPVVLGPEWEKRLQGEIRRLNSLIPLCEQCETCGIDCEAYREAIKTLQDNFNTFLKVFFPK